MRGHHIARLDPLGIYNADLDDTMPSELTLHHYGLSENDLSRQLPVPGLPIFKKGAIMTLGEILKRLQETYCQHIGFEYMYISEYPKIAWMRDCIARMEAPMDAARKQVIMDDILDTRVSIWRFQRRVSCPPNY